MKKNLFFIFLIISSFSFSQEKWTLEMCVKRAIDEFVKINNFKCDVICSSRFAKIEKF